MATLDRPSSHARTRSRRAALQALYQWQMTGADPVDIETQFHSERQIKRVDPQYFHELLHVVPTRVSELDAILAPFLDRPIGQIDPVELTILRIGTYEIGFRPDVPNPVIINEAVELAKMFGAEQAHRYVNGILDAVAKRLCAPGKPGAAPNP